MKMQQSDRDILKEKGISIEEFESQLEQFRKGFPFLKVKNAATVGNGIMRIDEKEEEQYVSNWQRYLEGDRMVTKFVPASGAASRMFKDLYAFLEADYDVPKTSFEKTFFEGLDKFAFYFALDSMCKEIYEKDCKALVSEGRYKDVVSALLSAKGLNYGNLPKGLLLFHNYPEGNRTPVGEHLSEGVMYAKDKNGEVNIHFTVSKEHMELFELLVAARKSSYEQKLGCKFNVSYSIQKPSTDKIAVDLNNEPFRNSDGSLLFRPGGHGALIENLNDIDSDVVFIKNIDNVVPDKIKERESFYKKLLAGVLVTIQGKAFEYLKQLESDNVSDEVLNEMLKFTEEELSISRGAEYDSSEELKEYLFRKLNRPFRVCAMVKNEGEPGGGPFIVYNSDGTSSPQILESSQLDSSDKKVVEMFESGSHFNPVDLVCGVKNYKGDKFNLTNYVDKNTGFISHKSKEGRELKALELPGLWNGSMSDWNTIFVEVPLFTFNPVKTVNDLLRPQHQ